MKRQGALVGILLMVCFPLLAQNFISAKAGVVNYEEGRQLSSPRQLHEGEYFSEPVRTEILLTPGTFLRLERNSEIQMLSTRLDSPAFELVNGVASLEIMELPKEVKVQMAFGDFKDDRMLEVDHKGIYRFEVSSDGSAMMAMVEKGELRMPGGKILKDGEQTSLSSATGGALGASAKFDKKVRDDFDIWSAERSELLGVSSYRASQGVTSYGGNPYYGFSSLGGLGSLGYGYGYGYGFNSGMYPCAYRGPGMYAGMGMWGFDPSMGYFTYLGCGNGLLMSPYGSYYYNPMTYYRYLPPATGGGVASVGTMPSKPVLSPRFANIGNNNNSSNGVGRLSGTSSAGSSMSGSSMSSGSGSGSMSAGGLRGGGSSAGGSSGGARSH